MPPRVRTISQKHFRLFFGCCVLLALLMALRPFGAHTHGQGQNPQIRPDVREAKIRFAKALSPSARKIGKMLRDARLPFDISVLFSPNWQGKLDTFSGLVPDLTRTKIVNGKKIKGLLIADTLILPERVDVDDDTVIITRQLIFAGPNALIKGNYDLTVMQSRPTLSATGGFQAFLRSNGARFEKVGFSNTESLEIAKRRGLLVVPTSIKFSVDGYGADEWLEDQKKKESDRAWRRGMRVAHHSRSQDANADSAPGETGPAVSAGLPGVTPGQTATGPPGDCAISPDGGTGTEGDKASKAGTGQSGNFGYDALDAGTLNVIIGTNGPGGNYSAHGGRGGTGGPGGDGGTAAAGGQGGKGGPGKVCDCAVNRSGSGGTGGKGGKGGKGGDGGAGGMGGTGGSGGIINIVKPCDWTGIYTTEVGRGLRGLPGARGRLTAGGAGGPGGPGGDPAVNAFCGMNGGTPGSSGGQGVPGDPGDTDGDPGQYGEPGDHDGPEPNVSSVGNCGGPGGGPGGGTYTDIRPVGYGNNCTEYEWISVQCDLLPDEEEEARLHRYAPTVKANSYIATFISKPTRTPVEWHCEVVNNWYAGCF